MSVSAKSGPQVFLPGDAVAAHTQRGTSRKQNEDRLSVVVSDEPASEGDVCAVFNVYDGHGGFATAEWLRENFTDLIGKEWSEKQPEYALTSAYLSADKKLLVPQGFMGMGERGRGGSKCGSTVATAVVFSDDDADGAATLVCANAGDARSLIVSTEGSVEQMSEDHVPDNPDERDRIERNNPTPKVPLVRFVGGTWRIGGLLALSRALGDAYLKSSGLFEGIGGADDDYSSGFGLIALPFLKTRALDPSTDHFLIVASDGLNSNPERGGGGGLGNDEVAAFIAKNEKKMSLADMAKRYVLSLVHRGIASVHACQMCLRASTHACALFSSSSSSSSSSSFGGGGGGGGGGYSWVFVCFTCILRISHTHTRTHRLAEDAVKAGSTDDVTIVLVDLRRIFGDGTSS